jgi:hypothetical protein
MTTALDTSARAEDKIYVASQWQLMWWRFRKHKLALICGVIVTLLYSQYAGIRMSVDLSRKASWWRAGFLVPWSRQHLSEQGLRYRKRYFRALIIALASFIVCTVTIGIGC